MPTIYGTVANGRIDLAAPAEWPDGTPVCVVTADESFVGMREEDWPTTPEAIEAWCTWLDGLEPLVMTPEDEARIRTAREEQRAYDHAAGNARADRLAADLG
jgi:hypothetical protein